MIEQVAASLAQDITPLPSTNSAEFLALLEASGPVEFVNPELDDPVEWVMAQRQKEAARIRPYWAGEV